jgi:hypothetical protein
MAEEQSIFGLHRFAGVARWTAAFGFRLHLPRRARIIEINGVAHVILTVSDWERCRPFYEALLHFMGLKRVFGGNDSIY